jgi:hypothetical protein
MAPSVPGMAWLLIWTVLPESWILRMLPGSWIPSSKLPQSKSLLQLFGEGGSKGKMEEEREEREKKEQRGGKQGSKEGRVEKE